MGGEGSGRKPDVIKMMQQQEMQMQNPIVRGGDSLFLPNTSWARPEAKKGSTIGLLSAVDDGTYITISFDTTKLFRIEKSTGQLQVPAGVDTDITL